MTREKEWWEKTNPYSVVIAPPLETIDDFVAAVLCDDSEIINHCLWEARQNPSTLYALFQAIAVAPSPAPECKIAFHSAWISQGLWLRDEFSIDPLIPAALANLLPGYSGPPLELFRGERWSNHEAGTYGPSWSSKQSVAEMFASGLNRCPETGGVLLRTFAPSFAILVGPTSYGHSQDEHEYVVDRRCLQQVEVIEFFPSARM
jgi:hypothetical protein